MEMVTLNLVSSICWEIIARQPVRLNVKSLPLFKLLLDAVYDFSPVLAEQNLKIYWRYSRETYLEITEYFSFCSFVNLTGLMGADLYLVIRDGEKFYADTENFLKILDLMELKRLKEQERNKYDLRCEADEIEEEIKECRLGFENSTANTLVDDKDDKDIIQFALRNMPMERCYTADICSGYSLIDCVRKGWPKTKKLLVPYPDETLDRKAKKAGNIEKKQTTKGGKKKK